MKTDYLLFEDLEIDVQQKVYNNISNTFTEEEKEQILLEAKFNPDGSLYKKDLKNE